MTPTARTIVLVGVALSIAIVCYVLATSPPPKPQPACAVLLEECVRGLKREGR